MVEIAPYGTWTSPLSAADVAASGVSAQWLGTAGSEIWWAEARTGEGGRVTLVRSRADGTLEDVLPTPWNVRNRVHEYGGRPWLVMDDVLVFTHWVDQRVYRRDLTTGETTALTPEPTTRHGIRYGDLRPGRPGEVWLVRERSTGPRRADIARDLIALPLDGGTGRVLSASHHFLTAPQPSPDGSRAAWIGWNHPAMPWDGTELCVADVLEDGTFGPHRVLAGAADVAVCQVEWESADSLLALLDPDGWWNLYRVGLDGESTNLAPVEQEIGGALWKLGARWFTPLGGGKHAVLASGRLAILDEETRQVTPVAAAADLTAWSTNGFALHGDGIVGVAAGPKREGVVLKIDLYAGSVTELASILEPPSPDYLSTPVERIFRTEDGDRVPAFLYLPANTDFAAPEGERPPLLVYPHGGPTGRDSAVLDFEIAYFTSRGIAVVTVNYGGSTGHGRAYRERLREQWGVVDVADCVAVADALAAEGTVDGDRLAIRGGSAGGYTSAASLTTTTTYRAGTVMYPILDLYQWTGEGGETHDFESRYLDGLIGPLPEAEQRYLDRSPINNAGTLAGPLLFLQGLEDEICPPEQADRFVAGLAGRGIEHAYLRFEGEQHGFRKAETIVAALEAELSFYGQVLGFETPGVATLPLNR